MGQHAIAKSVFKIWLPVLFGSIIALNTTVGGDECKNPTATTFAEVLSMNLDANRPGATAIVVQGGIIRYRGAFGVDDMTNPQPLKPDMRMRAGTLTKPFTAAAVLMLAEQGKLTITDEVHNYLTDFPNRGITIEQLLTHSSGLVNYTDLPEFEENYTKVVSSDYVIGLFKDRPLQLEPGTKVAYSNSNFFLLGAIIEAVTQKPYADFMKEAIFEPLGMSSTSIETNERQASGIVPGHTRKERVVPINPSFTFAAGALLTNVDDLARWNAAIDEGLLLGEDSWKKAFTPFELKNGQKSQSCYGWGINKLHDAKLLGHEGQTYGYSAMMMRFPNERLFVAVLSNDDRSHVVSMIGSWFRRTDPVCLAGQLATIAMRHEQH